MATHSSVLAWRIPGTGEPGGLPSLGSHRIRHDWSDLAAAAAAAEVGIQLCLLLMSSSWYLSSTFQQLLPTCSSQAPPPSPSSPQRSAKQTFWVGRLSRSEGFSPCDSFVSRIPSYFQSLWHSQGPSSDTPIFCKVRLALSIWILVYGPHSWGMPF